MGKKQDAEVPDTEELLEHSETSLVWRGILGPPQGMTFCVTILCGLTVQGEVSGG